MGVARVVSVFAAVSSATLAVALVDARPPAEVRHASGPLAGRCSYAVVGASFRVDLADTAGLSPVTYKVRNNGRDLGRWTDIWEHPGLPVPADGLRAVEVRVRDGFRHAVTVPCIPG